MVVPIGDDDCHDIAQCRTKRRAPVLLMRQIKRGGDEYFAVGQANGLTVVGAYLVDGFHIQVEEGATLRQGGIPSRRIPKTILGNRRQVTAFAVVVIQFCAIGHPFLIGLIGHIRPHALHFGEIGVSTSR